MRLSGADARRSAAVVTTSFHSVRVRVLAALSAEKTDASVLPAPSLPSPLSGAESLALSVANTASAVALQPRRRRAGRRLGLRHQV